MSAYKSLRTKKEFNSVYRKGNKISGMFFSLRFLENKKYPEDLKIGIALGLNISKSSVLRNKKRRQIKEVIRLNQGKIRRGYWLVVLVNEKVLDASYQEIEREFLGLCSKANLLAR